MKYLSEEQKVINTIVSEIDGLVLDLETKSIDKNNLFVSIANIMIALDKSDQAIKVFEDEDLGKEGKETALMIKINLGY